MFFTAPRTGPPPLLLPQVDPGDCGAPPSGPLESPWLGSAEVICATQATLGSWFLWSRRPCQASALELAAPHG